MKTMAWQECSAIEARVSMTVTEHCIFTLKILLSSKSALTFETILSASQ